MTESTSDDFFYGPGGSTQPTRLQQTKAHVDEVIEIMKQNYQKVLERDAKLSELDNRADILQSGAMQFEKQSCKLKRKMWWKNLKMMVIIGVIILFVLMIAVIWVANSFGSSGDNTVDPIAPATTPSPIPSAPVVQAPNLAATAVQATIRAAAAFQPLAANQTLGAAIECRDNAEELNDFIRDVGLWQMEMEAKEKKLLEDTSIGSSSKTGLPEEAKRRKEEQQLNMVSCKSAPTHLNSKDLVHSGSSAVDIVKELPDHEKEIRCSRIVNSIRLEPHKRSKKDLVEIAITDAKEFLQMHNGT